MKNKIKKINLVILGFFSSFICKVKATPLNIAETLNEGPLYGVVNPREYFIYRIFGIIKVLILPILFVLGLIVLISNCVKYKKLKEEEKSRAGQRLYGTPSVMRKIRNDEFMAKKKIKNRIILMIILLTLIFSAWAILQMVLQTSYGF